MNNRCSYCGKEFPPSVTVCPYDQHLMVSEVEKMRVPRDPRTIKRSFVMMGIGLMLILIGFGEPILEAAFHKKGTISVMLMLLLLGSVMISSGFGVLVTGKPSDSPRSWMWFGLGLMVVLTMILFWILGEMGYPYRYR